MLDWKHPLLALPAALRRPRCVGLQLSAAARAGSSVMWCAAACTARLDLRHQVPALEHAADQVRVVGAHAAVQVAHL